MNHYLFINRYILRISTRSIKQVKILAYLLYRSVRICILLHILLYKIPFRNQFHFIHLVRSAPTQKCHQKQLEAFSFMLDMGLVQSFVFMSNFIFFIGINIQPCVTQENNVTQNYTKMQLCKITCFTEVHHRQQRGIKISW